jgi:hypothetical protein
LELSSFVLMCEHRLRILERGDDGHGIALGAVTDCCARRWPIYATESANKPASGGSIAKDSQSSTWKM